VFRCWLAALKEQLIHLGVFGGIRKPIVGVMSDAYERQLWRFPLSLVARECEFANAGSRHRVARYRHRQQSAALLT
jgi:hypothetical protein